MPALYSSPRQQDFTTGATQDVNTARSNVKTPGGSMTWVPPTTPGGQWTQTTTLTPEQQAALTAQQKTGAGLSTGAAAKTPWAVGAEAGPMDYSKFMAGGSRVNGGQYYDKAAGDAVYKQFSDRQEPQFQRDTAALETQMRNQGLKPGDEAWNDQIRSNNQNIADQREQAQTHAQEVAASEGSRMQGMDVDAGNYNTSQRTQQIAQELQKRGYGVKEIQDMLQGMGVSIPSFATPGVGSGYSDAMARTYGEDANASKDKNASTGSWLNLATKAGKAIYDNYGTGGVVDKVAGWLGFSPAATTALPMSAEAATAATAANTAAASQIGTDIAAGANYGAGAAGADAAASGATGAQAASSGSAAAGSGAGAVLGGVAAAAGAAVILKHMSDNTAGMGYRESRQLADFMHTNAGIPDPKFGRGKYASTPISAPPPGFKTWSQYFAVTQVVQGSMHADGGKKDQGTYKMLLQEQGVPTDLAFYQKVWPGQEVAFKTIIGPNGYGTSSNSRGGR